MDRKTSKIVLHVDVAIKSYAISILTGSTFDGFIDCTNIKQKGWTSAHEWNFCIVAKLDIGKHCQHPIPLGFCKCSEINH